MTQRRTEPYIFEAPVSLTGGVNRLINFITSITPSVYGQDIWQNDGTVRTVTNFDDGITGQSIIIRGDGNLTIANNANIKTNTAANKLLAANKIYRFTLYDIWIEDA